MTVSKMQPQLVLFDTSSQDQNKYYFALGLNGKQTFAATLLAKYQKKERNSCDV